MTNLNFKLSVLLVLCCSTVSAQQVSEKQRAALLKRFPAADSNKDGKLSVWEMRQYAQKIGRGMGAPSKFRVDPGWKKDTFPDHAICHKSPAEIKDVYATVSNRKRGGRVVTSYDKPDDGSLRIVATGHSFMAPGFRTLPGITRRAGLQQPPLLTHTGGGITGSARYKWEQENGIFEFDKRPVPKLLASIANAQWDAMIWGPYYQDEPEYYSCWIDFCLKHNPDMKFFVSDAWPQLEQFKQRPKSEKELTHATIAKLGAERNAQTADMVGKLNSKYPNRVFVMPTSDSMVLAVREFHQGNLPGIAGVHKSVGGKTRSLWKDQLGHLGPGLEYLEGYVFYATIYQRSPELLPDITETRGGFPSRELDRTFRKIAWEAVTNHPLTGIPPNK